MSNSERIARNLKFLFFSFLIEQNPKNKRIFFLKLFYPIWLLKISNSYVSTFVVEK